MKLAAFSLRSKKVLVAVIALTVIIIISICQISLQKKTKGNLHLYFQYRPISEKCTDFTVSVNGRAVFYGDSIGKCSDNYKYIDTVFNFPIGFKTVRYSSKSLDYIHEEKMLNLLFISTSIDLNEGYEYGPNSYYLFLNKEFRWSYFPLGFM